MAGKVQKLSDEMRVGGQAKARHAASISYKAVGSISFVIIALVCVVLYGGVSSYPFVTWDDDVNFYKNQYLINSPLSHLGHFWASARMSNTFFVYRPITYSVFALIAAVPGHLRSTFDAPPSTLNPSLFHVSVLVIHTLTVWLAFLLIRKVLIHGLQNVQSQPQSTEVSVGAIIGALIFAVHPLQVETVAWATGLMIVLGAAFSFGSLLAFLCSTEAADSGQTNASRTYAILATLLFVASLLSYPISAATPIVALALHSIILRRGLKQAGLVALWFAIDLVMTVMTSHVEINHNDAIIIPLIQRPILACFATTFYLAKILWPSTLTIDYCLPPSVILSEQNLWLYTVPPLLILCSAYMFRRNFPVITFGLVTLLAFILPVLGFTPFRSESISIVFDRYMYMAMLGPAIVCSWLVVVSSRFASRIYALVLSIFSLVIILLAFQTSVQLVYWRNSVALYSHAVELAPNAPIMHLNYANALAFSDRPIEAEAEYRKAISMVPTMADWWVSLAVLMIVENRKADAISAAQAAVKLAPNDPIVLTTLGDAMLQGDQIAQAVLVYREALCISPRSPDVNLKLAKSLYQLGESAAALNYANRALALQPGWNSAEGLVRLIEASTQKQNAVERVTPQP